MGTNCWGVGDGHTSIITEIVRRAKYPKKVLRAKASLIVSTNVQIQKYQLVCITM